MIHFSQEFWTTRLTHGLQVQQGEQGWTIAFSEAPPDVAKVQALVAEIRQTGAAQFVHQSLAALQGHIVPDAFLHNLTKLFQAITRGEATDLGKAQSGPKRLREGLDELPPAKRAKSDLLEEVAVHLKRELGDVSFVFEDGTQLAVHRSLLSYYPYWARMFSSGMQDAAAPTIPLKEVDPTVFKAVLHWLYTGAMVWPEGCEGDRQGVMDAIAFLIKVDVLANRYELSGLIRLCEVTFQRLSRLLAEPIHAATFFETEYPLTPFTSPQSEIFYDVTFGSSIKANRVVLAARCRFFQEFFQSHPEGSLPIPAGLSPDFLERWIADIMAGDKNELWPLSRETVFELLKLAHAEGDQENFQHCCAYIAREGLIAQITEEHAALFCHLELEGPRERWLPFLTDPRLRIRSLTIHPGAEFQPTDFAHGADLVALSCKEELPPFDFAHFPNLERIGLTDFVDDNKDLQLKAIAENCPKLIEIEVGALTVDQDESLIALIKKCPQLRSLDCQAVSEVVAEIANSCKELRELKLTLAAKMGEKRMNEALGKLADKCHKLRVLAINNTADEMEGLAFADSPFIRFAENCYGLKSLTIWGPDISGDTVQRIGELCPQLAHFHLYSKDPNTPSRQFFKYCPALRTFELFSDKVLSVDLPQSLFHLALHCNFSAGSIDHLPHLRSLDVDSMPINGLIQILQRCRHLERLSVMRRNTLTPSDLEALATAVINLKKCALKRIELEEQGLDDPKFSKSAFESFKLRLPGVEVKGPMSWQ